MSVAHCLMCASLPTQLGNGSYFVFMIPIEWCVRVTINKLQLNRCELTSKISMFSLFIGCSSRLCLCYTICVNSKIEIAYKICMHRLWYIQCDDYIDKENIKYSIFMAIDKRLRFSVCQR